MYLCLKSSRKSYFISIYDTIVILRICGIIIANQERHKDERISESSITTADGKADLPFARTVTWFRAGDIDRVFDHSTKSQLFGKERGASASYADQTDYSYGGS